MDAKKTGVFISELRKESGMTQRQLAEKLSVSDKAISRWETGRGYPDIESLLSLSELFSVSINEILCAEKIKTPDEAKNAECEIAESYIKVNKNNRRNILLVVSVAVIASILLSLLIFGYIHIRPKIMGSPDCVIASDYTSLTLFGKKYVPIELGDAVCKDNVKIIEEAQVEGATFIGKLLFGDWVYSVFDSDDLDIIHLYTDYDPASEYYCKEDKVNDYLSILHESEYNIILAEITTKNWEYYDIRIDGDLSKAINDLDKNDLSGSVDCDYDRSRGDESVAVYSTSDGSPFRYPMGEILRKNGEYYWFDYDDARETEAIEDHTVLQAYVINDKYDETLDSLFSRMFK